jgi:prepilin-type N-terminal cleavage/methylation domain-containing protein
MKRAFTLIELAIVLVIMSILIVIAIQGAGLVKSSRLNNARSFTAKSPIFQINGLIAWYEASSKDSFKSGEAYDGAQISEWHDINPFSIVDQKNKMTRAASAAVIYKAEGINKIPTIQFSGAGKISLASFFQGVSAQGTVFLVFSPQTIPSGTAMVLFDSNVGANATSIGITNASTSLNAGSASAPAATYAFNNNYVIAVNFNGASSMVYVNNATTGSAASPGTNQITGLTIGTDRNTANGFNGYISEVVIYNRPLKLQERKDVMKYLARKYGVAVTGL